MRSAENRYGSALSRRSLKKISRLAGRQHAHQLHRLRVHRLQPAHHVDQRREEAHQRGDRDLRLHAVAHDQHQDRRLGHHRDRVEHHAPPGRRSPAASCCARTASRRRSPPGCRAGSRRPPRSRSAAGWPAARRAWRTASATTAHGEGAMKGLTSKMTTTAHHSSSRPTMPSAGSMRRRHCARAARPRQRAVLGVGRRRGSDAGGRIRRLRSAWSCRLSRSPARAAGAAVSRTNSGGLADGQRAVVGQIDRHDLAHAARVGGQHQHALAEDRPPRGCCG